VAELADRAGEPLGDLPFTGDFQGAANVSVGSIDSCLVRVMRSLDCLVGGGPGRASIVAWLVERELWKPTIATATVPPRLTRAAPAPISADSTAGFMPRRHRGQRHQIERGRRAGMSNCASLTPRSFGGSQGSPGKGQLLTRC
jgi:hypothetical protein